MADQSPHAAPQPANVVISPEQFAHIKQTLIGNFEKMYHEFMQQVRLIPVNPAHRPFVIQFFDTGYLWQKNGIEKLEMSHILVQQGVQAANPDLQADQIPNEPANVEPPDAA